MMPTRGWHARKLGIRSKEIEYDNIGNPTPPGSSFRSRCCNKESATRGGCLEQSRSGKSGRRLHRRQRVAQSLGIFLRSRSDCLVSKAQVGKGIRLQTDQGVMGFS